MNATATYMRRLGPLGCVGTCAESSTFTASMPMTSRAMSETLLAMALATAAALCGSGPVTRRVMTRVVVELSTLTV